MMLWYGLLSHLGAYCIVERISAGVGSARENRGTRGFALFPTGLNIYPLPPVRIGSAVIGQVASCPHPIGVKDGNRGYPSNQ